MEFAASPARRAALPICVHRIHEQGVFLVGLLSLMTRVGTLAGADTSCDSRELKVLAPPAYH